MNSMKNRNFLIDGDLIRFYWNCLTANIDEIEVFFDNNQLDETPLITNKSFTINFQWERYFAPQVTVLFNRQQTGSIG